MQEVVRMMQLLVAAPNMQRVQHPGYSCDKGARYDPGLAARIPGCHAAHSELILDVTHISGGCFATSAVHDPEGPRGDNTLQGNARAQRTCHITQ